MDKNGRMHPLVDDISALVEMLDPVEEDSRDDLLTRMVKNNYLRENRRNIPKYKGSTMRVIPKQFTKRSHGQR